MPHCRKKEFISEVELLVTWTQIQRDGKAAARGRWVAGGSW
jgi:hypothetical protein